MQTGRLERISVSPGGVPKVRIEEGVVGINGLEGDGHRDKKYHGGPQRALCLFSMEVINSLRQEGHPIAPGTTGENLTISGMDWATVVPGKRYQVGEVEIEITAYTTPCMNIADSFAEGRFIRISNRLHEDESRVYAKVLKEGVIRTGAPVTELVAERIT